MIFYIEDTAEINRQLKETKLVSLSWLTASIAHEIHNPRGPITQAAQYWASRPSRSRGSAHEGMTQEQSKRMNAIIRDVLRLYPQGTAQFRTYLAQDLAHAIQRSIQP